MITVFCITIIIERMLPYSKGNEAEYIYRPSISVIYKGQYQSCKLD